jgi:hypothetical protein
VTKQERQALNQARKALKSVKQSFEILFSPSHFPLPQDSIAMGCVKGVFVCVPNQVNEALAAIAVLPQKGRVE